MITEGIVALIWATVAAYFFYGEPAGYTEVEGASKGFITGAPEVVNLVCNDWLGVAGGILALLGVVAAPITSGDTALRSARLIIAEWLHMEQRSISKRLLICVPIFASAVALLIWQMANPNGFNVIWNYFGWANQTLAVFTLWTLTVYLAKEKKCYFITLLPAMLMTAVCSSFLVISKNAFGMDPVIGYCVGGGLAALFLLLFIVWKMKQNNNSINS